MTQIVTNVKDEEWKTFLDNCNDASIYHTPQWKTFLEKTFNYESNYLFAKDDSENIIGLLPLFYVKSKLTGNRLCSLPFSHICGYLGSKDAEDLLISEGIDLYSSLNANYFEIRDSVTYEGFQCQNSFSTHILELSSNVGEIWSKLDKGSVRWATTKSKKMGVSIENTKNIDDLKEFYELNCVTKKDIGVPCHPWKFFKNMFKFLNEYTSLYVSKFDNEIIGGGLFTEFNDTVIYGYGAADPDCLKLHPYNAFIWKCIEDSCINGYKQFDFGRTSYDNKGLIDFKRRWGTIETKLYCNYYPKDPGSLTGNRENIKYKYGTKAIQKIPLTIYKKFSEPIFQHFG